MNNQEIISKLWNLCNVLRDDGITYFQYVTELTYILFLKIAKEKGTEENIPEGYRWKNLADLDGTDLRKFYVKLLNHLGENGTGIIKEIYKDATTSIKSPNNLRTIIKYIDLFDWSTESEDSFGTIYEGLLEKNANETKSGAGQYFTPRPLIDCIVRLMKPQPKERCNDPACGTFGFMIAAARYVRSQTDDFFDLPEDVQKFEFTEAFTGCELVQDTHRLALMNAMLHNMYGKIILGDTLSDDGTALKDFDLVLTNPPFGTKKGGETSSRSDFTFTTSNKQLNFLQHIYHSLKRGGRAAVILPDNVLFADGDGEKIRVDLMHKCNLHTVLRLPTGIFYAQGVKTNVLFFKRGYSDFDNTKEVWFYDLRTNMPSFGKTAPLTKETFAAFENAFNAIDRRAVVDERFSVFTRAQIAEKNNSLDLGLIRDDSVIDTQEDFDLIDSGENIISQLQDAAALVQSVVDTLKSYGLKKNTEPPANWLLTTLENVAEIIMGQSPKGDSTTTDSNYTPLIGGAADIGELFPKVSRYTKTPTKLTTAEDVIICVRATLGKPIFSDGVYCLGRGVAAIRPRTALKEFLRYAFINFEKYLYDNAAGSTFVQIPSEKLKKFPIPLPPLAEQKRIVAQIDFLFEKLNLAQERLKGVLSALELHRVYLLKDAFDGALTAEYRKIHGFSKDDWQQKTLGEIISLSKEKTESFDAALKYVGLENIEKGSGKISFQNADGVKSTKNIFYKGDLLYGKLRPYLNKHGIANFDGVCSTDILVLNSNELSFNKFIDYFFNLPKFIEYAVANSKGINLPRVSAKIILAAEINLPPLEEQKEIARLLDNVNSKEKRVKEIAEKTL